jgi:archaea-specific RecJ-like exonuclease
MIVESELYGKLAKDMAAAVNAIKAAIQDKKPILIRHHADCDGYSGAVALERSILGLLYDFHKRESDIYYHYRRSPSRTPYYDYSDATKDVSNFLQDVMRHEHKRPLVILVDLGSTQESSMAIHKLKVYGADVMVIDHHPPRGHSADFLLVNPASITDDYALSAGMICSEIAKQLDPRVEDLYLLAALSGVSDKCQGPEVDAYLEMAKAKGYTREKIAEIAECIDYEVYYLGFLESRYMVDDLFFGDLTKQKSLLASIRTEIDLMEASQKLAVLRYSEIVDMGDFVMATADLDLISHKGEYPRRGHIVGMLLKDAADKKEKPAIAIGFGSDYMTFRCDKPIQFDINALISDLKRDMPYAMIDGGGHPRAGTLRMIPASRKEVMEYAYKRIRDCKAINT